MYSADERPFIEAIWERYSDDEPRWVYADFLQQRGERDRAEHLRLQLTLAQLPIYHPRRSELAERATALLTAYGERWLGSVAELVDGVEFRRGLPDSFAIRASVFLSRGAELFRRAFVRRLRIVDAAPYIAELADCPHLAHVRELDLCLNELGSSGIRRLCRSPYLTGLECLELAFTGLDDAAVELLAGAGSLSRLTGLSLSDNRAITAEGVRTLTRSPYLSRLRSLDLSGNEIDALGVRYLANGLAEVDSLKLGGNPIGDEGVMVLARSRLLRRVVGRSGRIELYRSGIGPQGAALLGQSAAMQGCAILDLSENHLGDEGFAALVASPHNRQLRLLNLARNQVSDSGIARQRRRLPGLLSRLATLDLSGNCLTPYGISLLQNLRGESSVLIQTHDNLHSDREPSAPVPLGQVLGTVLQTLADTAALRHRVAHPRLAGPQVSRSETGEDGRSRLSRDSTRA